MTTTNTAVYPDPFSKDSLAEDRLAQFNSGSLKPMSPKQFGVLEGSREDFGWTWDQLVLFVKLYTLYPLNEIKREQPYILSSSEAHGVCGYLMQLRGRKGSDGKVTKSALQQVMQSFEKMQAEDHETVREFWAYVAQRDAGKTVSATAVVGVDVPVTPKATVPVTQAMPVSAPVNDGELRTVTSKHCPSCHEHYDGPMFERARVCMADATPLVIEHKCPDCGKVLPDDPDLNFCIKCGSSLRTGKTEGSARPVQASAQAPAHVTPAPAPQPAPQRTVSLPAPTVDRETKMGWARQLHYLSQIARKSAEDLKAIAGGGRVLDGMLFVDTEAQFLKVKDAIEVKHPEHSEDELFADDPFADEVDVDTDDGYSFEESGQSLDIDDSELPF